MMRLGNVGLLSEKKRPSRWLVNRNPKRAVSVIRAQQVTRQEKYKYAHIGGLGAAPPDCEILAGRNNPIVCTAASKRSGIRYSSKFQPHINSTEKPIDRKCSGDQYNPIAVDRYSWA